ncbi:MAG: DinB family protein [Acidobacteria bacterium]|nr:DinB family protein [Acidobacteriota bacterium]
MTYYGGKDLANAFRTVRKNTIQIAEEIPENKYDFRAAPDTRTIGQSLVHIAFGPSFQLHIQRNRISDLTTVNFPELFQKIVAEESTPRTKAEIVALLRSEGDRFASFVEGLDETFLAEQLAMPPGAQPATKSRFEMLLSPKEHEMHHRAQLMVLERMIGIVPHLTRQMQERMAQAAAAGQTQR